MPPKVLLLLLWGPCARLSLPSGSFESVLDWFENMHNRFPIGYFSSEANTAQTQPSFREIQTMKQTSFDAGFHSTGQTLPRESKKEKNPRATSAWHQGAENSYEDALRNTDCQEMATAKTCQCQG